jgi:hypothetical protein
MMRSKAELIGTILYIDGREWEIDLSPDEAVEVVNSFVGEHAPSGVRIWSTPYKHIKRKRSQVGWPGAMSSSS